MTGAPPSGEGPGPSGTPLAGRIDWIAVDWGSSHLRAWAMSGERALAALTSDAGTGTLVRDGFEPALLELIHPWLGDGTTRVVICGMAGSRQGWREAPYRAVPCAPLGAGMTPVETRDPRLSVRIVPGLRQDAPPDVMRGEETQIAGFLAQEPQFDGVLCLPGTHTKWARLSAGEVVGFRTAMTGELFALLSERSVLRHTVGAGWDDAAFRDGVADGMGTPEQLTMRLFGLRAAALLHEREADGGAARARLSGLLIGAELAGARGWWLGTRVAILGADGVAALYASALASQGCVPERFDVDRVTRQGLLLAMKLESRT